MLNAALIVGLVIIFLCVVRMATMLITTSWSISETSEGVGIGYNAAATHTGNSPIIATIDVPVSTSNQQTDIDFTVSQLQALIITTNTDVTLYVNAASGGSPTDTIVLKSSTPWVWEKNSGIACPIVGTSGAVSAIYITNASASVAAVVKLRGLRQA